jgi:hypothetical protein
MAQKTGDQRPNMFINDDAVRKVKDQRSEIELCKPSLMDLVA